MNFIKSYFGKEPDLLTKQDIELFIEKKIEESKNLDYKRIDILRDAKKLCKHICAFANSEGGLLLVGISEKNENNRIYPDKITWGDPSYTKEQLENVLLGNISPHVKLDIIPVRKSIDDPSVIFLINVPHSYELHMTKNSFYKRVNFQSIHMNREEIISFIRERLKFDECAMFRFQLREFILEFIDEMLYRLVSGYDDQEKRKKAKNETIHTIQKLLENWDQIKNSILAQTPIINIIRFADSIKMYTNMLKRAERFPHDNITTEEKILFIELSQDWIEFDLSDLRTFFLGDAKAHGVPDDWRDPPLEFEKKTRHKDHVIDIVGGSFIHIRILLEDFLNILEKISGLETNFGVLRESPSVKLYFD